MGEILTEAPCKDCQRRQLHCHSSCGDYKAYREYRDRIHEEKMKRVDETDFIRAVKRRATRINILLQRDGRRRRRG